MCAKVKGEKERETANKNFAGIVWTVSMNAPLGYTIPSYINIDGQHNQILDIMESFHCKKER